MNAPEDRLRSELADLAAEVHVVDLRDRALRTSRRLGIRRAVITGAAVVAVVAIAAGAAFAIQIDRVPVPPPVDNNSVSPSPLLPPSPQPSSPPSTGSSPTGEAPVPLAGTLFYVDFPGPDPTSASSTVARVQRWSPGGPVRTGLSVGRLAAQTTLNISPDGRKAAWVEEDRSILVVANVDGTGRKELGRVAETTCREPVWSPDSKRLLTSRFVPSSGPPPTDGVPPVEAGTFDAGTGAFRKLPGEFSGCHVLWSADNSTLVFPSDSRLFVADASGHNVRTVPGFGPGTSPARVCNDVESVSPDGSRVVLWVPRPGEPWGDIARGLYANTVVDTRTGKAVDLPIQGTLSQAIYLADGKLLVRVEGSQQNRLVLLSPQLTVLDERDEPAALKTSTLLSHAPG